MKLDRGVTLLVILLAIASHVAGQDNTDWPAFRGAQAKGIADQGAAPTHWNADPDHGPAEQILWLDWCKIKQISVGPQSRS